MFSIYITITCSMEIGDAKASLLKNVQNNYVFYINLLINNVHKVKY